MIQENMTERGFRVPQVVLLVLSEGCLADPESIGTVKASTEKFKSRNIEPIVVVTRVDEARPNLKATINPASLPEDLETNLSQIARTLGVQKSNLYPVINYTDEITRSFEIEFLIYIVLRAALRKATDNIARESNIFTQNNLSESAGQKKLRHTKSKFLGKHKTER